MCAVSGNVMWHAIQASLELDLLVYFLALQTPECPYTGHHKAGWS